MWDRAAFERQIGGDRSLGDEIIGMFLEDCPDRVGAIRTAINNGDAPALVASAHALKGAAAYLAAQPLRECAAALERAGREQKLDGAPALLSALETAVAELLPQLRASHD